MASERQINRLPGLLAVKMIQQQISLYTINQPTRTPAEMGSNIIYIMQCILELQLSN